MRKHSAVGFLFRRLRRSVLRGRLPTESVDCSLTVGARRCPPNQTLNGAGEATDEKELRFAQPDPFSPQERSPTDPDVYVAATGPLRSGS